MGVLNTDQCLPLGEPSLITKSEAPLKALQNDRICHLEVVTVQIALARLQLIREGRSSFHHSLSHGNKSRLLQQSSKE